MTKLTELETKLVENMITNDFGDAPDHHIWADCWDCGKHGKFCESRQISGVVSSLVKKGIVVTEEDGRDGTFYLSEKGQELLGTEEVQ